MYYFQKITYFQISDLTKIWKKKRKKKKTKEILPKEFK